MKKIICLFLVFSLILPCTACAFAISAIELSKGYERTSPVSGEINDDFIKVLADFSLTSFKGTVTKDKKNDLISPLSAILCLAMIANGADGNTKAQIESAIKMDVDSLNKALFAYTSSLYSSDECKINLADSIWIRNDGTLNVKEEFLQTNADWFDAQVYSSPFDNSTVKDINNWCNNNTNGMIKEIIDRIDSDMIMYLINAFSFDAKWADQYESKNVVDYNFNNYDGTYNTVKMLTSTESSYISADGVTGFAKNYKEDKYSFVALLPSEETDIYQFIDSLTGSDWIQLWNSRNIVDVQVTMPEFTYESKMDLNALFANMGMSDMFNSESADFSKLGKSSLGNIYCAEIAQKTFIQVDRNGTKAAAITWGGMNTESCIDYHYYVTLDRPFVYAIVDNATGLPIFIGAITYLK